MRRIVFAMEMHPDDKGRVRKYQVTYPYSEENLELAQKIAYNGEVTVEDIQDIETEPTTDDVLNALLGVSE